MTASPLISSLNMSYKAKMTEELSNSLKTSAIPRERLEEEQEEGGREGGAVWTQAICSLVFCLFVCLCSGLPRSNGAQNQNIRSRNREGHSETAHGGAATFHLLLLFLSHPLLPGAGA